MMAKPIASTAAVSGEAAVASSAVAEPLPSPAAAPAPSPPVAPVAPPRYRVRGPGSVISYGRVYQAGESIVLSTEDAESLGEAIEIV